ncbi:MULTISPECIES: hypothetical protein [Microcystis]|uniref:hypothetical protein n=1 Tax=Microcystis TaxID=1125 RepID=UPI001681C24D|nr:hypothetical protein [Microcystis wesenbergii]MBD2119226.1 hypothetical protein [Microcystis wesenbergii FACHB-1339]
MVNVIRGSSAKPVSSQRLAKYFEERTDIEGTLYIGYPIIGTPQGGYQIAKYRTKNVRTGEKEKS